MIACALLLAAFFASRWFELSLRVGFGSQTLFAGVQRGEVTFGYLNPDHFAQTYGFTPADFAQFEFQGLVCRKSTPPKLLAGLTPLTYSWPGFGRVRIVLWIPLLLVLTPTLVLWARDRRRRPGHCYHCAYNLTGNTSGRCPECGQAITATSCESAP